MADTPKHSVSVAGIVVDDKERVLVVQRRDNGHWEPPGGVLELSESPQHGVIREILEETGFKVAVRDLSGVYKNLSASVVSLVFTCVAVGGEARVTNEAISVAWKRPTELQDLMDEAYFVRVADAFEAGVQVRTHDGISVLV